MQVESYKDYTVTTSPGFTPTTVDFGIKNPAIIFDMLCNRVYQRPLQTMIQEYICNARDAHREIGKSDPIKIILPTSLDPYLSIIDKGPGLSPERMNEVFIFLGESTKRADNTQTGGFGIGAKVGWAYTDSFSVISTYNNVKTTYLAYIGDEHIGKLSLLEEKKVDDNNGVEIRIKIKRDDFSATEEAVNRMCRFFDIEPIVKNRIEPFKYIGCDNKKSFFIYPDYFCESGLMILIDGVPYPVSSDDLELPFYPSKKYTYCLSFPVGCLNLAINRESIRYDKSTIAKIQKTLDKISDKISDYLVAIKAATNLKEVQKFVSNVRSKYPGVRINPIDLGYGLKANVDKYAILPTFDITIDIYHDDIDDGCIVYVNQCVRANELKSGVRCTQKLDSNSYRSYNSKITIKDTLLAQLYVHKGESVPKERILSVFNDNDNIDNVYVVCCSNKKYIDHLVSIGFIDTSTLKQSLNRRYAIYTDNDVRKLLNIHNSRQKFPITDIIKSSVIDKSPCYYCAYKERGKYESLFNNTIGFKKTGVTIIRFSLFDNVYPSKLKCTPIVVTQDQIPMMEDMQIPHIDEYVDLISSFIRNMLHTHTHLQLEAYPDDKIHESIYTLRKFYTRICDCEMISDPDIIELLDMIDNGPIVIKQQLLQDTYSSSNKLSSVSISNIEYIYMLIKNEHIRGLKYRKAQLQAHNKELLVRFRKLIDRYGAIFGLSDKLDMTLFIEAKYNYLKTGELKCLK